MKLRCVWYHLFAAAYLRYYQVYPGYDCYGNPWDVVKSDIGFIYATYQQAADACDALVNCVGFRSSTGVTGAC